VTDQERLTAHALAAYDEDPDATMAAIAAASSAAGRLVELEARAEVAEDRLAKDRAARAEQIEIASRFMQAAIMLCCGIWIVDWVIPGIREDLAMIWLALGGLLIGHADGRRTGIKRLPA
jgi:hypothetical protein